MGELRIAVVGAGIAGLATAGFLTRAGLPCTVFEQSTAPSETGAGIQLSPNGTRLLHRIGLAGQLIRVGVRPAAIEIRRWQDNRPVARTRLGAACEATFGAPYCTLHRADLYHALLGPVRQLVRPGRRCVAVREYPDRVELSFVDGSTVDADLVIGADGLHSVVRRALVPDVVRFAGLVAYRGLVHAERVPSTAADHRVVIWLGPGRHVVCYPIGRGLLNVVAVVPDPVALGPLADAFPGWSPAVQTLLAAMPAPTRWPLYDRPPLSRWRTGRIVLVGDAAHPLLPFGAQGANQAIEDAATLAAHLDAGRDDVAGALARYERARVPRLAQVRAMVRDNGVNHHLPDGEGQRRRDAVPGRDSLAGRAWLYGYDAELVAS
ncbi:MAG: salicylate 1-monooxygenase [Actinobacteria bacterium]|nr:MAG: salicylate 1-monooxygenase [Actinomycetota bacterium]